LRQERRCADEPGNVHVVAAGMRDRHRVPVAVRNPDFAGIGQAGLFLDRQRIHIGAQHDGQPLAVAQQPDDAGLADRRRHVVTGGAQPVRRQPGCPGLLHRKLGMRVHIGVKRLQFRRQAGELRQRGLGRTRLFRIHEGGLSWSDGRPPVSRREHSGSSGGARTAPTSPPHSQVAVG